MLRIIFSAFINTSDPWIFIVKRKKKMIGKQFFKQTHSKYTFVQ